MYQVVAEIFDAPGHIARSWKQPVNDARHAENLAKKLFREHPECYVINVHEVNGGFGFSTARELDSDTRTIQRVF